MRIRLQNELLLVNILVIMLIFYCYADTRLSSAMGIGLGREAYRVL